MAPVLPLSFDDVLAAAERLRGVAHRTPVLTSRTLDAMTGGEVHLKAENLQRAGAFKFRGAYSKLSTLLPHTLKRGVVTYSSGNHGQAVALAARILGTTAVVVMPEDTPRSKRSATEGYGAEVITYDRYTGDREAIGAALSNERGLTLVPPYDDQMVMAGQGTAALELFEQVPNVEVLVVPVGGGGLIAGSATVARATRAGIRITGVEPATGDDHRRSLAAGERVALPGIPRTIADGLQSPVPGALTFEVNRHLVDEIVTVTDEQMVEAMAFLFERLKVVVEPSGAVGVAALLSGAVDVTDRTAGVVLSGGNVSAGLFAELVHGPAGR